MHDRLGDKEVVGLWGFCIYFTKFLFLMMNGYALLFCFLEGADEKVLNDHKEIASKKWVTGDLDDQAYSNEDWGIQYWERGEERIKFVWLSWNRILQRWHSYLSGRRDNWKRKLSGMSRPMVGRRVWIGTVTHVALRSYGPLFFRLWASVPCIRCTY